MLTIRDRMILDLESSWFKHAGAKDSTISHLFSMTPTRYYAVLNRLLSDPAAEAEFPLVVRRLRRLRDARRQQRTATKRMG